MKLTRESLENVNFDCQNVSINLFPVYSLNVEQTILDIAFFILIKDV